MADFTTPMIALPYNFTAASNVDIVFAETGAGTGPLTVSFALTVATDLYNDRAFASAANLAKDFVTKANAAETQEAIDTVGFLAGTWSVAELTGIGGFIGRIILTRTAGSGSDDLTTIDFTAEIVGADLGFASDSVAPTSGAIGGTYTFESPYCCGRQWIPRPSVAGGVLSWHVQHPTDIIVETRTPDGAVTQDLYGASAERQLVVLGVEAASVHTQWAADSDYLPTGQTVSDPNVTFESLRSYWARATTGRTGRFYPDMDDSTTYVSVLPLMPWLASTSEAAEISTPAPLKYDFDFRLLEV